MRAESVDLAGLERIAERLAVELAPGSVVWLTGPLGAGKTTLVRALVRARDGITEATSPTYALVHEYAGTRGPIYHVDCYRLRHADQASDLDWQTLCGGDLLLIEWPERAGAWTPPPTATIALTIVDDTQRGVAIS